MDRDSVKQYLAELNPQQRAELVGEIADSEKAERNAQIDAALAWYEQSLSPAASREGAFRIDPYG